MNRAADRLSGDFSLSNPRGWAPIVVGGSLIAYGLSRRSVGGLLVAGAGGAFALQNVLNGAATGKRQRPTRSSILVSCDPAEAYRFWRRLENLPQFMHHLESVTLLDDGRSQWTARGFANTRYAWTAEIVSEREGEIIAWRSVEGSPMQVDGSVMFRPAPGERGTIVAVALEYRGSPVRLGGALRRIFGRYPSLLLEQDLRRFKALMETGEIPTVEGQTHGPRSMKVAVARMADPTRPIRREWKVMEIAREKRRVS
jgi:uncharacterized membrane protein